MNKILIYVFLIILTVVSSFGVYYYIKYDAQLNLYKDTKDSLFISTQNSESLKSKLDMKADSIQTFALMVNDINSALFISNKNLESIKSKYNILYSDYKLLGDSLSILNNSALADILDSIITVRFNGNRAKINYDGYTAYDIKTQLATYSINININPTLISSLVYADSAGIIRQNIYADNTLINDANTIIDSSIFLLIKNNGFENNNKDVFDRLHVLAELYNAYDNKVDVNFGLFYEISNFNLYYKYLLLRSGSEYGIRFNIPIKDFVNILK